MRILRLIPLLVLLASCANNPIDPARRSNAQTTGATTQQSGGNQSAEDAAWARVDAYPAPTAEHLAAQCPGATNAEIDAALNSDEPWICYAATREAAK